MPEAVVAPPVVPVAPPPAVPPAAAKPAEPAKPVEPSPEAKKEAETRERIARQSLDNLRVKNELTKREQDVAAKAKAVEDRNTQLTAAEKEDNLVNALRAIGWPADKIAKALLSVQKVEDKPVDPHQQALEARIAEMEKFAKDQRERATKDEADAAKAKGDTDFQTGRRVLTEILAEAKDEYPFINGLGLVDQVITEMQRIHAETGIEAEPQEAAKIVEERNEKALPGFAKHMLGFPKVRAAFESVLKDLGKGADDAAKPAGAKDAKVVETKTIAADEAAAKTEAVPGKWKIKVPEASVKHAPAKKSLVFGSPEWDAYYADKKAKSTA